MHRSVRVTALGAVLALTTTACLGSDPEENADTARNADATEVSLTIAANAVSGGKNAEEADWIENYVIPTFIDQQAEDGVEVTIEFQSSGVDDEEYKSRIALDLRTGSGADIVSIDGIWVGEFAEAGYIQPLTDVVGGDLVDEWDGWPEINEAVQANMSYNDERYGVPAGSDGRVLYFNKDLFAQAGLPEDWQPTSWEEILEAGRALQALPGVTPIQLNAGTAMGEATTMQGALPMLVGTGAEIYGDDELWQGDTQNIRDVLDFYSEIYSSGLGDPTLQQEAQGRDKSFAEFAAGQIGILLEGDYFWRSVIEPTAGVAPMANRDDAVGYALVPSMEPGSGINGQDFVSMSGGGGRVLNPATEFPQQAWELLAFMNSAEATKELVGDGARLTQREDVNQEILSNDPLLTFIAEEVVPLSAYRPGLAVYPEVSLALQQATLDVVTGTSPEDAAANYQAALEQVLGGADDIASD